MKPGRAQQQLEKSCNQQAKLERQLQRLAGFVESDISRFLKLERRMVSLPASLEAISASPKTRASEGEPTGLNEGGEERDEVDRCVEGPERQTVKSAGFIGSASRRTSLSVSM